MSDQPQTPKDDIFAVGPDQTPAGGNRLPPLPPLPDEEDEISDENAMGARIDRLSGEPAPDISPEEFARLQRGSGGLNIDSRGRIRATPNTAEDPGVSLRKRRAWYC